MVKKSSVYDRREVIYLKAYEEGFPEKCSFDEILNHFTKLKQKYLEHEFLYKHKVFVLPNWFDEEGIMIEVVGPESDDAYNKRIERYEKRLVAQQASVKSRKENSLKKRIEEFKKMKESLAKEVNISEI